MIQSASMLFKPDSPAYPETRYYQDAAIRAAFEKIIQNEQAGGTRPRGYWLLPPVRAKPSSPPICCGGSTKPKKLPKPALFLCDRDELREQAYTRLKAVFGDNARIVLRSKGRTLPRTLASTLLPTKHSV
jgi:type I restriction enzyme R subunit